MIGRSIRIYLPDGTPGNLFTGEIINWTGSVTVFPRAELSRFVGRKEAGQPGVYLLVGQDPEEIGREMVYVGETEGLGKRLKTHDQNADKDFWEQTFAISSKDANLTKSHVRYLEARLVQILAQAGRARLANGTLTGSIALPPLPEADAADMEYFLSQLLMLLPVVGFGHTRPKVVPRSVPANHVADSDLQVIPGTTHSTRFELDMVNVRAEAVEANGEFVVLKGSFAREQGVDSWTSYRPLREQLIQEGKLQPSDTPGLLQYTEDVVFRSPSAAASVTVGRNSNGRRAWHLIPTGQQYGAWKDEQIAAATNQAMVDER